MTNILTQLKPLCTPDHIILRNTETALSYKGLESHCEALSVILENFGIKSLALHTDNGLDWLITDFTCQSLDICLLPLPNFFSISQLKYALKSSPVDAIITDNSALPGLFENISEQSSIKICGELLLIIFKPCDKKPLLPENTGKITYTSGSTGTPKGVCLSNHQLLQTGSGIGWCGLNTATTPPLLTAPEHPFGKCSRGVHSDALRRRSHCSLSKKKLDLLAVRPSSLKK